MKKLILAASCTLLAMLSASAQTKVFYVELKEGKEIPAQPIMEYKQANDGKGGQKIAVYPEVEFQTIEGVGGTFNEIGGVALMSIPKAEQEKVMANLFGKAGAQFPLCRTAIGASDFGVDAYSYSETPEDYKMKHFSIDREKTSVIPYIQMALKNNPDMVLFGSPWSPPAWMKHSGVMDKGITMPDKNKLKDDPKIYEAYALYFSKYVKAYAKEGITVDKVIIQNETDIHTGYPSCVMPPAQMYKFVADYLRPRFDKDKIKTEIWAGTFRTYGVLDALEFVANEKYLNSVDGIGIQYTSARYISDMNALSKGKPTMHTECNCHDGKNNVSQAFKRLDEVASYINNGIPNFAYWNMILNETTSSGWGWKQNSLINIDRTTKKVTYNPDYAVMSLLSKYMQPGGKRVASFCGETTISVKKDGKVYLFVQNSSDKVKNYTCTEAGKKVAVATVPANSVAVIVY